MPVPPLHAAMHAHGPVQCCTMLHGMTSTLAQESRSQKPWTTPDSSKADLHTLVNIEGSCRMTWNSESRVTTSSTLCLSCRNLPSAFPFCQTRLPKELSGFQARYVVSFWSRIWKPSNVSTWYRSLPDRWRPSVSGPRSPTVFTCLSSLHSQPRRSSTATTVAFSGSSSITALILIRVMIKHVI